MKKLLTYLTVVIAGQQIIAQTYDGRITSNSITTQQPQLYLRNSGSTMSGQQFGYIFTNMAHGIMFQASTSGVDANTAVGHMVISTNGRIGIGTNSPTSFLDVHTTNHNSATGLVISQGNESGNSNSGRLFFENVGDASNSFAIMKAGNGLSFRGNATPGSSSGTDYMTLTNAGRVGIGLSNPSEKLHVNGNIELTGGYRKIMLSKSNVSSEFIIAGHGQGGGLMINAEYSTSGNPQSNASFTVNPGTYNTSAGYLDYDGNARRWTLFNSAPSSGVGTSVSFIPIGIFDDSFIAFSTTGNEADFRIGSSGNVGIGTTSPDEKLTVKGTIHAEEVKVDLSVPGPDYVFEADYNLRSLEETEAYIKVNKRLPETPSAKEMEANGVQLGEMNMLLLKKIEELTLHMIKMNKENMELRKQLKSNSQSQDKKIEELTLQTIQLQKLIEAQEN